MPEGGLAAGLMGRRGPGRDLFGADDAPTTGQELLGGEENATLGGAMAGWDVSRLQRPHPEAGLR